MQATFGIFSKVEPVSNLQWQFQQENLHDEHTWPTANDTELSWTEHMVYRLVKGNLHWFCSSNLLNFIFQQCQENEIPLHTIKDAKNENMISYVHIFIADLCDHGWLYRMFSYKDSRSISHNPARTMQTAPKHSHARTHKTTSTTRTRTHGCTLALTHSYTHAVTLVCTYPSSKLSLEWCVVYSTENTDLPDKTSAASFADFVADLAMHWIQYSIFSSILKFQYLGLQTKLSEPWRRGRRRGQAQDLLVGISVMSPEQFVSERKISGANPNLSLQNGEYAKRKLHSKFICGTLCFCFTCRSRRSFSTV